MQFVSVPVIRAFQFEGRDVTVGEALSVSPAMAAALHRRGLVSLDCSVQVERKDLTPEPDSKAVVEPPVEPAETVRKKRQYKRRDLKAED